MKIAIYSKSTTRVMMDLLSDLSGKFLQRGIKVLLDKKVVQKIITKADNDFIDCYSNCFDLQAHNPDMIITVGGDGTFLGALLLVRDSGIPILGLNMGRLGFLSHNNIESIDTILEDLLNKQYSLEKRTVLEIIGNPKVFTDENYALNDFTIHKRDNSSLSAVTVYLQGEFFNTYWGDGIIISTPTGSTAYSMSCGGPIVFPDSSTLIITPVAPHNLNLRPVIIPDNVTIQLEISGRERKLLISADSRYQIINQKFRITVRKAPFTLSTIKFNNQSYSKTINEKLNWGKDFRNIF